MKTSSWLVKPTLGLLLWLLASTAQAEEPPLAPSPPGPADAARSMALQPEYRPRLEQEPGEEPPPFGWAKGGQPLAPRPSAAALSGPLPPIPSPVVAAPNKDSLGQDSTLLRTVERLRKQESDRLQRESERLIASRQYSRAVRSIAAAYAYRREPSFLFSLARACRKADLDVEAYGAYQSYLSSLGDGDSAVRATVEDELRTLQAKLEEPELAVPLRMREHLESAKRRFQSESFAAAAEDYALAYALKPLPRLLFNMAQSHRRAGRMSTAYLLYAQYLEDQPNSPLRKETLSYLAELRPLAFQSPLVKRPWFWGVMLTATALVVAGSAGLAVATRRSDVPVDSGPYVLTFAGQR